MDAQESEEQMKVGTDALEQVAAGKGGFGPTGQAEAAKELLAARQVIAIAKAVMGNALIKLAAKSAPPGLQGRIDALEKAMAAYDAV